MASRMASLRIQLNLLRFIDDDARPGPVRLLDGIHHGTQSHFAGPRSNKAAGLLRDWSRCCGADSSEGCRRNLRKRLCQTRQVPLQGEAAEKDIPKPLTGFNC